MLGICGPTCSGKTIVSKRLIKYYKNFEPFLFSLDMYYKDIQEKIKLEDYNFDEPDALDYNLILKNFKDLLEGKEINIPTYDYKTHKRISYEKKKIETKMVIFEGIFLFYFKEIREKLHFKVFLEAEKDEIIKRRLKRDIEIRGSEEKTILKQLNKFVFLGNEKFVEPYKKFSDLIIPHNLTISEKIKKICLFSILRFQIFINKNC